jgi:kinesin family member 2/24
MCGFYEIYNGQLYDLLNKNNRLILREDGNGSINVIGLLEIEISNLIELRSLIDAAQSNRHIGCTSFNQSSSRSHAIFQFKLPPQTTTKSLTLNNSPSSSSVKSKINTGLTNGVLTKPSKRPFRMLFIDLAGSERGIDAQNNELDNRKEGAEINQSLLAVIFQLLFYNLI